jgi:hypothetical protein
MRGLARDKPVEPHRFKGRMTADQKPDSSPSLSTFVWVRSTERLRFSKECNTHCTCGIETMGSACTKSFNRALYSDTCSTLFLIRKFALKSNTALEVGRRLPLEIVVAE